MICCRGVEWLALKDESHAQVHTDGHVIGKNIDIKLEPYGHRRLFSHPNRVFKNQRRLLTEER